MVIGEGSVNGCLFFVKGFKGFKGFKSSRGLRGDFDNLGGGYIIVGVEENNNGLAKRPVAGIDVEAVDGIVKKMKYYVRTGSSSIEAKGEVLDELRDMANRMPFDERPNPNITMNDISKVLLRDYLATIGSRLEASLFSQPLEQTLEQMDLMTGPTENRMIKNVAAMMFCEHPEKFFGWHTHFELSWT